MSQQKIMIVDDNSGTLFFAQLALEDQYNVFIVEGGVQAAEQIIEIVPDLVLLDLMMPLVGGLEVCEALKASHPQLLKRIVIQTASPDALECQRLLELGVAGIAPKPVSVGNMLELVASYVNGSETGLAPKTDLRFGS